MNEFAFRLKKGSKMYEDYMKQYDERNKFNDFAKNFFKKYEFTQSRYIIGERLRVELDENEVSKYSTQLLKDTVQDCYQFKKNSKMQKLWDAEVVNNCDMQLIWSNGLWYWPFMQRGKYAMWHYNGNVYGCLTSESEIKTCDDMEPLKMSEYYQVIEEMKAKYDT